MIGATALGWLAAAPLAPAVATQPLQIEPCDGPLLEHPEKVGVGIHLAGPVRTVAALSRLGAAHYYNWSPQPLDPGAASYTPMIWGGAQATTTMLGRIQRSSYRELLGFNEPDNKDQAAMSVETALALWPRLMETGKRLGSPATAGDASQGWQRDFMAGVAARGLRVDFMAVHFYQRTPDVAALREYLDKVHRLYGRPIWLTEYSLANWDRVSEHSLAQQARYEIEAAQMMDGLDYVERHYWFTLWPYRVAPFIGWQTSLFDDKGRETLPGYVMRELTGACADATKGHR